MKKKVFREKRYKIETKDTQFKIDDIDCVIPNGTIIVKPKTKKKKSDK